MHLEDLFSKPVVVDLSFFNYFSLGLRLRDRLCLFCNRSDSICIKFLRGFWRRARDTETCLPLVLEVGVDLPTRALQFAGVPELVAFRADWTEAQPDQVMEHGVV